MIEVLARAGCFVAIIVIGYMLRRAGFFQKSDFNVLSKIVLKITLPAAIVTNFARKEIDPSMLALSALCLGLGVVYMAAGYLINIHSSKEKQAFTVLNIAGYNIGNFALPFIQSFLGPAGVIATSLFDTGNAFICLGGSLSIASAIKGGGRRLSLKRMGKTLVRSLPFDCYIIMLILSLTHISLPSPILSFAEIVGNSNAFLAMLMIGVGFELRGDRERMGDIIKILAVRYGIAVAAALFCYFILPFSLETRQALTVLMFSPVPSGAPAYTAELESDVGLASAVNSLSILCSIVCMIITLMLIL